ncbi:MAG: GNAT family N-acetyltransferase [Spirosomataceae bacterium]
MLHYVTSEAELADVKAIFLEYIASLGFDISTFQNTDKEFADLLSLYGPPKGCMLVYQQESALAGCVALKEIAPRICEMKRLYVRPAYRGQGIAHQLVAELLTFARQSGYKCMKLDTLSTMTDAIRLYESFGFVPCEPYVYNPMANALYFELTLSSTL